MSFQMVIAALGACFDSPFWSARIERRSPGRLGILTYRRSESRTGFDQPRGPKMHTIISFVVSISRLAGSRSTVLGRLSANWDCPAGDVECLVVDRVQELALAPIAVDADAGWISTWPV
jgi:hypothetical protein